MAGSSLPPLFPFLLLSPSFPCAPAVMGRDQCMGGVAEGRLGTYEKAQQQDDG